MDYVCNTCESRFTEDEALKCPQFGKVCPDCESADISPLPGDVDYVLVPDDDEETEDDEEYEY